MPSELHSTTLHALLDSMQRGNLEAREELFRRIEDRVRRLCRKMLSEFPSVGAREDTLDVMQNALIRLMRALDTLKPASTREFFGLAAEHIRRELLDLARYYRAGKRPVMKGPAIGAADDSSPALDPAADTDNSRLSQRWSDLHEAAASLP